MFYSDRPIHANCEDQLNRKGFAKLFAHTLVHLDSKDKCAAFFLDVSDIPQYRDRISQDDIENVVAKWKS